MEVAIRCRARRRCRWTLQTKCSTSGNPAWSKLRVGGDGHREDRQSEGKRYNVSHRALPLGFLTPVTSVALAVFLRKLASAWDFKLQHEHVPILRHSFFAPRETFCARRICLNGWVQRRLHLQVPQQHPGAAAQLDRKARGRVAATTGAASCFGRSNKVFCFKVSISDIRLSTN